MPAMCQYTADTDVLPIPGIAIMVVELLAGRVSLLKPSCRKRGRLSN